VCHTQNSPLPTREVSSGSWLCENAMAAGLARSDLTREAAVGLLSKMDEMWTGWRTRQKPQPGLLAAAL